MASYWYPSRGRVEDINKELTLLEKSRTAQDAEITDFLPSISLLLRKAHKTPGFPQNQTRQWIWIASQLRAPELRGGKAANAASAAINFLGKLVDRKAAFDDADVQDLNWVVGRTIETAATELGAAAIRENLRAPERETIDATLRRLQDAHAPDPASLRAAVEGKISEITALSDQGHYAGITDKIDALFRALTHNDTEEGKIAKAALLYLSEDYDVVADNIGFLGLVDDIYVIEWSYALITKQTIWLPVLENLLIRWPLIGDLAFALHDGHWKLDRFSAFVACAFLDALFSENQKRLLVLTESGPYALIGALAAALHTLTASPDGAAPEGNSNSTVGKPVIVGDEHTKFKAIYCGPAGALEGKHWLGVRGNGRITIDHGIMANVAPAPTAHKTLSDGGDILKWIKTRHPGPLGHLPGMGKWFGGKREGVLFITQKKKLDSYLSQLQPFGSDIPALLGMRYVASTERHVELRGSSTDLPIIYACSDPNIALKLLNELPNHLSGWRIIVDGAPLGRAVWALFRSSGVNPTQGICILADLHDREPSQALIGDGFSPWQLSYDDVEVPRKSYPNERPTDDIIRFIQRQGLREVCRKTRHEIRDPFLEATAEAAAALRSAHDDESEHRQLLRILISTFLNRITGEPLEPDTASLTRTEAEIATIKSTAASMRLYDQTAGKIHALFASAPPAQSLYKPRATQIRALTRSALERSETVAVICRSETIAARCRKATEDDDLLHSVIWSTIDDLRHNDRYNHVIVPGWLDRLTMRELTNCAYAPTTHFLLFPFENMWLQTSSDAGLRWERKLRQSTATSHSSQIRSALTSAKNTLALWSGRAEQLLGSSSLEEPSNDDAHYADAPEVDYVELRIIEAIRQQTASVGDGEHLVKARLVLFEETGAFTYLFPQAKAIVLSGVDDTVDADREASRKQAEKMLFRSVESLLPGDLLALPVETDRDLIDAKADNFLKNSTEMRRLASEWRAAIRRYLTKTENDLSAFSAALAAAGVSRHPYTIRLWLTNSNTLAPRKYSIVIPLIAEITGDHELKAALPRVLSAIDAIYRARETAAVALVKELFSGSIDLSAHELSFTFGDSVIRYELHRVRSVEKEAEVPLDQIGRIQRISNTAAALEELCA